MDKDRLLKPTEMSGFRLELWALSAPEGEEKVVDMCLELKAREIQTKHTKAMDYAERALLAGMKGDERKARALYGTAFGLEREAAKMTWTGYEPTRSVLYRSAASLALQCDLMAEARELIGKAIVGNPPPEIAAELYELLDLVEMRSAE